jgi:NAD(P)-dependent dehydrogenase (short-subunit alcohol dehydrogenase family)
MSSLATSPTLTRHLAATVNALEPVDAVIHNADVYTESTPNRTTEGHPRVLAVNVLAPYLLTARINTPARLIYRSSGMHRSGRATLDDLDWTHRPWNGTQAYCDSKLLVTTLASAIARRWTHVHSQTRAAVHSALLPGIMHGIARDGAPVGRAPTAARCSC